MSTFAELYKAAVAAALKRGHSVASLAEELGCNRVKIYTYADSATTLRPDRLAALAKIANLNAAARDALEKAWFIARGPKGNWERSIKIIFEAIDSEVPQSKARHIWRRAIDCYLEDLQSDPRSRSGENGTAADDSRTNPR